jgi:hypothetical protein
MLYGAGTFYVVLVVVESLAIYQLRKRATVLEATLNKLRHPSRKTAASAFKHGTWVAPKPAGQNASIELELSKRMAGGEDSLQGKYGVGQPSRRGVDRPQVREPAGEDDELDLDLLTDALGLGDGDHAPAPATHGGAVQVDVDNGRQQTSGLSSSMVSPQVTQPRVIDEVIVKADVRVGGYWDCIVRWLTKHLDNASLVVFPASYAIMTATLFSNVSD